MIQAYFINGYLNANVIAPVYILILFIVSTIAIFWCIDTTIRFHTAKASANFVCFVDMCVFGALIAGVYELSFIANQGCPHWDPQSSDPWVWSTLGPFGAQGAQTGNHLARNLNKTCSMLKACFALGIMEVVFFCWSAFLAYCIYDPRRVVRETVEVRKRPSRSGSGSRRRRHSERRSSSMPRRSSGHSRRDYEV